jgi:glycosyltransferase involved in cell wall biosynthesis
MPDGRPWPRISVVTPSFNQGRFLEATLRSVLLQGYPDLEYFVMDGASTDESVAIIKKYEPWLTFWVSERDGGQSAAINRGLRLASGSWVTWINSDDMLCQGALATHAARVGFEPRHVYVGDCVYIDAAGRPLGIHRGSVRSLEDLVRIGAVWRARERRGHIVQPEVLFPRELALEVGALDAGNHRTMDYALWGRFFMVGARFEYTHIPFGMFRLHDAQKTGDGWKQTQSLLSAATQLVTTAETFTEEARRRIIEELRAYERDYWARTGLLARIGLPPSIVLPLRGLRAGLRGSAARLVRRHGNERAACRSTSGP